LGQANIDALLSDEAEIRGLGRVRRLAALGDSGDDALVLDIIRVVGLDVGGETVKGALDGFLGGRVHHAGLDTRLLVSAVVQSGNREVLTYCDASSGTQAMKVILLLQRGSVCGDKTTRIDGGAPLALASGVVFEIVDGVSATDALVSSSVLALCVEELLTEDGVVGLGRRVLDDNLLPVVRDLVDDPLGRLAELEVVECSNALGRNRNTVTGLSAPCTLGRAQGGS
jgi:hypothetical protein